MDFCGRCDYFFCFLLVGVVLFVIGCVFVEVYVYRSRDGVVRVVLYLSCLSEVLWLILWVYEGEGE